MDKNAIGIGLGLGATIGPMVGCGTNMSTIGTVALTAVTTYGIAKTINTALDDELECGNNKAIRAAAIGKAAWNTIGSAALTYVAFASLKSGCLQNLSPRCVFEKTFEIPGITNPSKAAIKFLSKQFVPSAVHVINVGFGGIYNGTSGLYNKLYKTGCDAFSGARTYIGNLL